MGEQTLPMEKKPDDCVVGSNWRLYYAETKDLHAAWEWSSQTEHDEAK